MLYLLCLRGMAPFPIRYSMSRWLSALRSPLGTSGELLPSASCLWTLVPSSGPGSAGLPECSSWPWLAAGLWLGPRFLLYAPFPIADILPWVHLTTGELHHCWEMLTGISAFFFPPFYDLVIPVIVIITVLAAGSALSLQRKVHHSSSLLFLSPGEPCAGPWSGGTGPRISVPTVWWCNTPSCWGTAGDQDHPSSFASGFISRQTASSSLPFL